VQLESIVSFGRVTYFVQLDGRIIERNCGIAAVALQSLYRPVSSQDDVRIVACFQVGLNVGFFLGVGRMDAIGGSLGSFEGVSNGQSDYWPQYRIVSSSNGGRRSRQTRSKPGAGVERKMLPTMKAVTMWSKLRG